MRVLKLVTAALLVVGTAACQAPSGTLVGVAPPPIGYGPPPPPPPYYGPPPRRCFYQDGPFGPERVCRPVYY